MISLQESVKRAETSIEEAKWENRKNEDNTSSRHFCGSGRNMKRWEIPMQEDEQRQLLRGLMNIRAPKRCSEEFLRIQDAYLQEAVKEKGIVE